MMVISIARSGDMASVFVSGCPLKCGYCLYNRQDRKEMTLEKVVTEMTAQTVKRAFIGGMDPAMQGKEVKALAKVLTQRGVTVSLKTSGNDPNFLKEVLNYADRFVFEIKAPLDDRETWSKLIGKDLEWTTAYLENLKTSLGIVKGKYVKISMRVIPGFIDQAKIERIGEQMRPCAKESTIIQFLGNMLNDYP
ncbi:MAG: radical SAM protein [Euryarchaeota archaeon]|nr:radical SAM protein [Euryarchaeota archaeon]